MQFLLLLAISVYSANNNQTIIKDFVAAPALAPPEVQVDPVQLAEYQKEMENAAAMPLPDEDDADL